MKTFLRIKWEIVVITMLFITAGYGWLVYASNSDDIRLLAICSIVTFMFTFSLIVKNTLKEIRQEVLNMWL